MRGRDKAQSRAFFCGALNRCQRASGRGTLGRSRLHWVGLRWRYGECVDADAGSAPLRAALVSVRQRRCSDSTEQRAARLSMISMEHAAAGGSKRKRAFSRNTRGGGSSTSRTRRRKRTKPAAAAPDLMQSATTTVLGSRRESRSVSISEQSVCFADGGGEGPEYMRHFSQRRREKPPVAARPTSASGHVDPRQSRESAMTSGESDSDSSAVYSSCSESQSSSGSTSGAAAHARDMVCRRRAAKGEGGVFSARSRSDALDRMPDLFTAEGETRRLAERARRCAVQSFHP